MLAIGIQYLTGYAAATAAGSRSLAEWPPHPGRVFMALAATYFETRPLESDPAGAKQNSTDEWKALRWLEDQIPPALLVSDHDQRVVVDVYVPPNDMTSSKITIIPAYRTNKQPRTFPRTRLHDEKVFLVWQDSAPVLEIRAALERLCSKLIRVGHSSSLVRAWIVPSGTEPKPNLTVVENAQSNAAYRLRIPTSGTLDYLVARFGEERIDRFYELSEEIQTARGKVRDALKDTFQSEFGLPWRSGLSSPEPLPPVLSATAPYAKSGEAPQPIAGTDFDTNLVRIEQARWAKSWP